MSRMITFLRLMKMPATLRQNNTAPIEQKMGE